MSGSLFVMYLSFLVDIKGITGILPVYRIYIIK